MIRFYDITPAQGDPAAPTGPYPETYGVEMTNTNVNETFIDAGGSSVPVTMAAILADLADDNCISCAYWMDTRYTTQLLDYYKKYTQQEALPDASATYDPAYINQFVDFINFIQTQNSNYSIDIYLDLNIISQTPSEARAIVDYLRDGDINGVTDITVAGVELSNEVYFNWARDLAGFALFNDYWAYVTGDVTWGDYTNDLGVLTHFTTITVDNPVSYAEYVMRPELYDNTATTYDPSHDFFAALKASPPVNIGLPAENPNGSDLVYGPDESDDYLLGGSDAWNVQLRSHYDDMFSPGVPLFDAVILHNYFQGSKYKDLILNNLCPKYPTYPGWSTPPFCLYSGICDPYGEWRYDVNDFRLEDAFNEFLGLTDPPPAWDAVVNLSDLFKGDPIDPDAGLPGYFNLLKEGINDLDAYGLQFGAGYDNDKQLWATEYNNKPTTSNMTNQESALMDIFLNNYPDGLLLFEWSLFNIRINSNALYHKDFFTASHLHAYAGGGGSCLLTIADCGDFKSFVNPSGVPSPIDPDPYKVPGPEPDENLYLRRTSYWSMKLISEINKQDLYYLHSNYLMPTGNPNVPPTLFRDPGFDYIVLFISNMKEGPQYITINPSSIAPYIFPAFLGFDDYVTINEVQVDRNYMSSGMSNMFDINTCYNCVKDLDIISDNPHPYDIYGITPTFNRPVEYLADIPDGIRFYMDGNSFGYVTIPILKIPERAGQTNQENKSDLIEIAPNPTNSSIKFWSDEPGVLNNDDYKITITSSTGQVMIEGNWKVYEDIDVTSLPSGIYFVNISTTGIPVTIKKLIKSS
ncbi:MAG: T9SS type A sorting domain-containing protein [Saprospiraceae bacterium]|nr:T9SS type A sorting domain-containing protein [Saprospiraceae bacterium]